MLHHINSSTALKHWLHGLTLATLASLPLWTNAADVDQPIHIRADAAELDEASGLVTYRGAVELQQGSIQLLADVLIIELEQQQVRSIRATGTPASYAQQLRDDAQMHAQARTILYHTADEVVELKGEAHLQQGVNVFSGNLIQYDMRAGRIIAEAEADEGVRMILSPTVRPR